MNIMILKNKTWDSKHGKKYFRNLPDFDYVDRTKVGQNISDYTRVKNLFQEAKKFLKIFLRISTFSPNIR